MSSDVTSSSALSSSDSAVVRSWFEAEEVAYRKNGSVSVMSVLRRVAGRVPLHVWCLIIILIAASAVAVAYGWAILLVIYPAAFILFLTYKLICIQSYISFENRVQDKRANETIYFQHISLLQYALHDLALQNSNNASQFGSFLTHSSAVDSPSHVLKAIFARGHEAIKRQDYVGYRSLLLTQLYHLYIQPQPSEGYCGHATLNNVLWSIPINAQQQQQRTGSTDQLKQQQQQQQQQHNPQQQQQDYAKHRLLRKYPNFLTPLDVKSMIKLVHSTLHLSTELSAVIPEVKAYNETTKASASSGTYCKENHGGQSYDDFLTLLQLISNSKHHRILVNFLRGPLFFCPTPTNPKKAPLFKRYLAGHWSPILAYLSKDDIIKAIHLYGDSSNAAMAAISQISPNAARHPNGDSGEQTPSPTAVAPKDSSAAVTLHSLLSTDLQDGLILMGDTNPSYGLYFVTPKRLWQATTTREVLTGNRRGLVVLKVA